MEGSRLALIVAVDQYDDPALRHLTAPAADADALAEVLADPALGNFFVETLYNETTSAVAERLEEFLSELRPADFALVHFSCHGLKDDSGELYLAARNTKVTRLASTGLDAALIDRLMRRSRAQQIVLLLDCCYGGAFQRGVIARAGDSAGVAEQFHQEALGGGRGRVVITASTAMEYSFEGSDLTDAHQGAPSLFSGALVHGLRTGDADRDEDGRVSLAELYEFVYDTVRQKSPHQTPSKWEYGVQGNLFVARTPRRRVRPRSLPAEIQELIQHGNPSVRLSAVSELSQIAAGEELSLAVAARTALDSLTNDDSRRVCTAAEAALQASRLRLPLEHHDFGRLMQGRHASAFTTQLEGPPLVETAEVMTTSPRLRVSLKDRTITVLPDTSALGELHADVTVSSPAGNAILHVEAHVVPPRAETPQRPGVPQGVAAPAEMTTAASPTLSTEVQSMGRPETEPSRVRHPQAPSSPLRAAGAPSSKIVTTSEGRRDRRRDVKLALILLASVLLTVALIVIVNIGGGSGDSLDSSAGEFENYGPPSEVFQMDSPWMLTVTSDHTSRCLVAVIRDDGDTIVAESTDTSATYRDGQYTRSVRIADTGRFYLRWSVGDEDDCRVEVTRASGGAAQTIQAP
ncbi:caspase family protein [Geodermatophilus sp. SYSU D00779]